MYGHEGYPLKISRFAEREAKNNILGRSNYT